ncbi:DUF1206 domain-containing protein [Actinomadura parmotrematis]|uniref:DUF1206 domain-containing protein n=1 Tax=Actinomadura parmotrematis TaxID=2864039 RepID=A0ABS7FVY4_9ACTN|nr:DUF1206 domain-containing protein [Actinomadura parmotrematis]MBW8484486.1 DUF1206 domain-containing protein [Actinomadura parmotrematis]
MAANVAGNDAKQAGRQAAHEGKRQGHKVASSKWFHRFSRAGLVARGVIYLLVGWLALQIAFGDNGEQADKTGAMQTIAEKPGGTVMLWLVVIGFFGLAAWRFSEAAFGQPVADGDKATKRLASFGRGIFYTAGFIGMLSFVLGQGGKSSNEQSQSWSAKAMGEPGGRWLVLLVGLGFVAWGVGNIVGAVRRKFLKKLKTNEMSPTVEKVVKVLGIVGRASRGLVFGSVGAFLVNAAVQFDPKKAKGLDGTLREFAQTPAGPWLLVAVAIGVLIFGAYSFCEARWRKVEAAGSAH